MRALEAQLKFQELRLGQMEQLQSTGTGRTFDVEQRQAEVDQLKGQVENARWNLDKTTVRAPADGYVTNVALRKGARVANLPLSPVMALSMCPTPSSVSKFRRSMRATSSRGRRSRRRSNMRRARFSPVKVETVLQAVASGQVQTSGSAAATTKSLVAAPFVVRIRLDDRAFADSLPAGAAGDAAIFTDRVKPAHMIRKVLLRQIAITNYINPF